MSRFTCAIERPRTITSAVYRLRSNLINYYPAISGKIITGASSTIMKALGRVPRVKTLSPLATPSMAPVHELGKASTSIHTCNRRVDSALPEIRLWSNRPSRPTSGLRGSRTRADVLICLRIQQSYRNAEDSR